MQRLFCFGPRAGERPRTRDLRTMTSGTTTRRTFLGATGTAALLTAARAAFPYGAHAAGSGPETTKAVLGFIALTDASPLVIVNAPGSWLTFRS